MSKVYSVSLDDRKKRSRRDTKRSLSKIHTEEKSRRKTITKIFFVLAIIVGVVATGGFALKKYAKTCEGEECNPLIKPILNTIEPKLKQENGLTNVLIIGIDTRDGDSQLMNTDTIIVANIDHENESVTLTSIPRDLWVSYTLPNGNTTSSKVNSAYASGEWQQEGSGIETLQGVVENITGQPIHYYVKVTLKGFIEIVDAIGGVDITVDAYYKDAYPASELPPEIEATCPPFYRDGKYCLFEFEEGTHHLDGQYALIYARMRLLSPRGDYDRARRQQQVIDAVKEKVLSTDTLLDPGKLWDMYNIVADNVETSKFTVNDLRAGLALKDKVDLDNMNNIVLDPMLGNVIGKYIYVGNGTLGRGYHIVPRDETFEQIRLLLDDIRSYPGMYEEAPVISIFNATGTYTLQTDWALALSEDNKIIQVKETNRILQDPSGQYQGISIYKFTEGDKPATETFLKKYFEVEEILTEIPEGLVAYGGEHYVVVIGSEAMPIENEPDDTVVID